MDEPLFHTSTLPQASALRCPSSAVPLTLRCRSTVTAVPAAVSSTLATTSMRALPTPITRFREERNHLS